MSEKKERPPNNEPTGKTVTASPDEIRGMAAAISVDFIEVTKKYASYIPSVAILRAYYGCACGVIAQMSEYGEQSDLEMAIRELEQHSAMIKAVLDERETKEKNK